MTRRLHGSCHCGAIRVLMETATTPDKLQVRACQCGFCRRHGGLTVSDPDGHLHIEASGGMVRRYRFSQMQSDYLFCEGCGYSLLRLSTDRCPECGAASWNPNDGRYGYCGRCHRYTGV